MKINFRHKLIAGFGIMALIMVFIYISAMDTIDEASLLLKQTLNVQVRQLARINHLQSLANKIRLLEAELPRISDAFAYLGAIQELQNEAETFEENLQGFVAEFSPADVGSWPLQDWRFYKNELNLTLQLMEAMRAEEALKNSTFSSRPRFQIFAKTLKDISRQAERTAHETYKQSIDLLEAKRRTFSAMSFVGIGLGLLFALSLARSLSVRIGLLREGALRLAEGRMETEISVRGHDEVAELAASFNQMRLEIQTREADLTESEARFRSLVETTSDWIWELDAEGVYRYASPKVKDLLGYEPEEIVDKTPFDLMPADEAERVRNLFARIAESGKPFQGLENLNIDKDGKQVVMETSGVPVFDAVGKLVGYRGIDRDITERKQAERDLRRAHHELERRVEERTAELADANDRLQTEVEVRKRAEAEMKQARAMAESANQAKSEFLANMSHEIRTPLNAVTGFSELLSAMVADPIQRNYLESIKTAGKTLLTLINDILDLSKIEAGMLEIIYAPVSLKQIFDEMEQIFRLKLTDKKLKFRAEIDERLPAALQLDETRVRQILLNLVGNAVKFTNEGSIQLMAEQIGSVDAQGRFELRISVTDTGIGIPADQQETVFESFRQAPGGSGRYGGTGLGLSISKRLVEMMNGQISVASSGAQGSTFEVVLKGVAPASEEPRPPSEPALEVNNLYFNRATVLVADDVVSNRSLLYELLTRVNLKVVTADNGQEALSLVDSCRPDLVIMDIRMPIMDGIEATQRLKANPQTKQIPVLALTASTVQVVSSRIRDHGFDGYLTKPVKVASLFAELTRHLGYSVKEKLAVPDDEEGIKFTAEIERPVELLASLQNKMRPVHDDLMEAMVLSDVKLFAERLIDLGQQHRAQALIDYGSDLSNLVLMVDIEQAERKIRQFPVVVEQINEVMVKNYG